MSYLLDPTYYANSTTVASLSSSNVLGPSQNRYSVNKRTKSVVVSTSSCKKKYNISTDTSGTVCDVSIAFASADLVNGISKVEKRRSSRKKGKRKSKQHKPPSSMCNTDVAAALDEDIHGTSVFESCSINTTSCGDGNILCSSFSKSAKARELSATPTTSVSYSGEEDESEIHASLYRGFSGEDFKRLGVNGRPHNLINSESRIHTSDVFLSNFDIEVADGHLKESSVRDDTSSGNFSEEYVAPISDSFSDCSNSDGSTRGSDGIDIQPCTKGRNGITLFDSRRVLDCGSCGTSLHDVRDRKEIFIHRTSYNSSNERPNNNSPPSNVVDAENYTDRSRYCGHGYSSTDIHSIKRGRHGRQPPGSLSGVRRLSSGGNVHGRAGKENGHSFWQRVQKDDIEECICEPKNTNPVRSRFNGSKEVPLCVRHDTSVGPQKIEHEKFTQSVCLDEISVQTDVLKRAANVFDSDVFSSKSEFGNLRNKVSEGLKSKPSSGTKQENHYSRKGPHTGKANFIRSSKMNMQQKKPLEIPKPSIYDKNFGAVLRSPYADSRRVGIPLTNRVNLRPSEPLKNAQIHLEEIKLPGPVCNVVSNMTSQAAQNHICSLSTTSDSLAQTHLLKVHSDVGSKFRKDLPEIPFPMGNEVNGTAKLEIDFPQAEYGKQNHFSGSISQKWVPVERKDAALMNTCRIDKLSTSHLEEAASDGWNLKNIEEDALSFNLSLENARVACPGANSGGLNFPSPDDLVQRDNLRHHASPAQSIHVEHSSTHHEVNCHLTHEEKSERVSLFETNTNEIAQVVNDAYRLQVESESVQFATGSPLAEFERLLCSASPVVAQTFGFQHCHTCSGDQLIGNSLCRHQIPNVSLESLWQWYEGPSSYGLEVKAEDYRNLKRMGRDQFEFRAYFVPYLSAVQFFGHSRSSMCCSSDAKPNNDLDTSSDNSSHLDKIFSVLLPRPRGDENTRVSPPMGTSYSPAASGQDECCAQLFTGACHGDSELLFEYFESEQPQQRRPLFEKIKELVRGNATSNCQIFGDPSKLDCLRLRDLHPSSWYSVAWYPIYRIPDDNFRSAFLTYHSLGHFIYRSSSLETLGGDTSIVSPAVGLQSYNAQGEYWFQPRSSVIQTEENPCFNPSEILRERLRTLEQTASVMARASVRKGDQKSMNRQPDYEFFLSRRR